MKTDTIKKIFEVESNVEELSKRNLNRILKKISKYKVVNDEAKVNSAIRGLCIYHCTNQVNVCKIIKEQKIKIKSNLDGATSMTNEGSDMLQGVDKHIAMSIGEPWIEYGEYCFIFSLEHITPTSLVFFIDPWKLESDDFENYFLLRDDFIVLLKELLSRNVFFFNKKIMFKIPFRKSNLHKLINWNCRKMEIKQDADLDITTADEFFVWTRLDRFMYGLVRICWNWIGLLMMAMLITLKLLGKI